MTKSFFFTAVVLMACSCVKKRDLSENTAIIHLPANPNGLHITNDISFYRAWIFDYTQQTLVKFDVKTKQMVPVLATGLPEADSSGLHYVYTLRDDARWDDGSSISTDDVVFSSKLVVCPATNNPQVKGVFTSVIKKVEKDTADPQKIHLYTHTKNRSNAEIFVEIFIMQKKLRDPKGITDEISFEDCFDPSFKLSERQQQWFDDFNKEENRKDINWLSGCGPYKITEWKDDSYLVLEKKKNWWGDNNPELQLLNEPDKIIFRIIKDETAVYFAIRNETIDATNRLGLTKLMQLQQHDYFNDAYQSEFSDSYGYNYIGMNMKPDGFSHKPVFTDKKVRKAIAHLVPADDFIRVFYKGKAQRQVSYVSPMKDEYNSSLPPVPFDPEKAKRLLDEAGWKDTDGDRIRDKVINGEKIKFSFQLMYFTDAPPSKEMALMMKEEFYKAGLDMNLYAAEFGLFYEKAFSHDFDMLMGAWQGSAAYEDPTQLWHTSQWANFGANFCGFGDAQSDSLIASVNEELNDSLYLVKVHELQKRVYDEQPYVFLFSPKSRVAIHRRFDTEIYNERPQMAVNAFRLLPSYSGKNNLPAQ
ncbi:MAG: ABC transporter substrate-binding protein [Bacteroidota bacterium]